MTDVMGSQRSFRETSYRSYKQKRPQSAELVDLHVYIVPPDLWREHYNNLLNQNVTETISAGIIRVHPEAKVYSLREEIDQQIGVDLLPQDYVFLKSVGRSITRLKPKQEYQLKAKHFIPPQAYAPELYLLEVGPGDSRGSTQPQSPSTISQQQQPYHNNQHYHENRDRSRKGRSPAKGEKYDGMYTNNTNEDSGINVITPENRYEDMDRRKPEEDSHPDVHARFRAVDDDENDRQRNMNGDQDDGEWERRRQEEEERRRREEEENRRREEEDRRREEEERRRREDERDKMTKDQKLTGSDEDLNRFPSPPPLRVADDHLDRDTESAKRRRKEEKERLMRELEQAREARRAIERQREELVKKAKAMQSKTQNRRNHARDVWKKRYFEEKKKTPPLEEHCNRLRHELDIIHRKLMNTLEGPSKDKSTRGGADMKPSQKNNYKIQATRLTHEIDDMRRRLENAKMKLTAEMKLRNQAETELRALRAELTQKKIHLTLTRNQQLAAMTPGTNQEMFMMPALSHRS